MSSKPGVDDEDVVTITNCNSSASNSSGEKSNENETSKELSRRLPPIKAQALNGFDDSDFLLDSPPEDLSAGDIRWLYNSSTGTFNVFSKMVEKKKRYEQQIVLPVHQSIHNSDESVGLQLHRNIFSQAFQKLTINRSLPLASSHTAYLSNNEKVYLHDGRYKSEFDEIRLIGKGGFAKVTEVLHKVDKQHYAVKRVTVKSPGSITLEKLSQEVTILAKLTKTPCHRIVRYHAAWLEEEHASGGEAGSSSKKEDEKVPSLASSSSSSSESSSSSSEEENPEHSDASIVFEESKETSVDRSKTMTVNGSKTSHVSSVISSSSVSSVKETSVSQAGIYFYEKEEEIVQTDQYTYESLETRNRKGVMDRETFKREIVDAATLRRPRRRHSSKPLTKYVLYIQMELCGKTLSEWLLDRNDNLLSDGPFSCVNYGQNIHILKQILEGVHFVHEQDILHRDLKPLNVFLTEPQLEVKIGDFGLAREVLCQEEENVEAVNPRTVGRQLSTDIGTSPYIAPEQQRGGDYDSKADMYSFGIIKYEMFHPFRTGMERSICIKMLREGGDIPEKLRSCWPEAVIITLVLFVCPTGKLIESLTNKDKMLRPSASDVLKCWAYCDHNQQGGGGTGGWGGAREPNFWAHHLFFCAGTGSLADTAESERQPHHREGQELEKVKEERDQQREENEKKEKRIKELEEQLKALQMKDKNS
ncbi:putative eukaryotic translation initiation factor 2-alpha kinase 1 isoform X4 [Apostichopus japonicus]|uniref:Putative eukaryotic translation initiation factor 2-alpha kinase 1 isoform X4 n=1 Tax=Stichopus japonicus TaxID=307972 RepID=A0A2G8LHZ7_STIJA|nr:putative eukaryotic translation initiation factor 2-alpha kinase 1 isoform X4 [Apostichopus japonicus]